MRVVEKVEVYGELLYGCGFFIALRRISEMINALLKSTFSLLVPYMFFIFMLLAYCEYYAFCSVRVYEYNTM